MFELEQNYKCGGRALFYLFIVHAWFFIISGLGLIFLSYEMYFGRLKAMTTSFLESHSTWYIDDFMISEWTVLLGISVIIVGYLVGNVHYRSYKFKLDEHAFHLRRGLFFIHETTIPYQQISKVTISRPYHYLFFGVAELDIVTADDRSDSNNKVRASKFLIPVISSPLARGLSKQLLAYASMSRKGQNIAPQYDDEDEYEDEDIEDLDGDEEGDE
ncbi:MAG: Membrane-flanked protein [Candidatus Taylorbacteria bacterium]|nr:Membrane-flanked protein [Candidatus Taylorbacteria bacterium]